MQTKIDFSYVKQFHACQCKLLWYQWFWLKPLWGQHHNTWNAHTLQHEGAKYKSQAGKTGERTGATIPGRSAILQHAGQRQTHNKREATTSCHPNTSYSKFMALFLGSQYFSEPSSSSTGFRASLKWGGAARLLIVRSALGWMALSKFRAAVQHLECQGTDWPRGASRGKVAR